MEHELIEVEQQTTALSGNVFSDKQAFQELFDISKMFASSSLVPKQYQGKPMDCAIAVDMANRMGVSPMMVMQNLYVVQGKPQWSGQACASLIKASGYFTNVKPEYFGEIETDQRGCYISAVRKEDGEIVEGTRITIKMAKDEGWYGKSGSKWQTFPEQMLAYRAYAFFARVHIPNALMGVYVEGEAEDILPVARTAPVDPFKKIEEEAEEIFQ